MTTVAVSVKGTHFNGWVKINMLAKAIRGSIYYACTLLQILCPKHPQLLPNFAGEKTEG